MCVHVLPLQIQDVAEQGVMFVGFLQQPGGGPCFLGQWDPEELSSLHSSPSPIHRHPFSAGTSPTDQTQPDQSGVGPGDRPFEPHELDHESVECNAQPLVPRELDFSPLKPAQTSELGADESSEQIQTTQIILKESLESTNPPQHPSEPGVDVVQWCPSQNPAETQGSQLRLGQLGRSPPERRDSTEKQFNLLNQRERRGSNSDGRLSSPELERNHEKKSSSLRADRRSRETTHNNNNHICLKSSEKDKNATSPPAQGRKLPASCLLPVVTNHQEVDLSFSPQLLISMSPWCCRDAALRPVQPHRGAEHVSEVLLAEGATPSAKGSGADHGSGRALA